MPLGGGGGRGVRKMPKNVTFYFNDPLQTKIITKPVRLDWTAWDWFNKFVISGVDCTFNFDLVADRWSRENWGTKFRNRRLPVHAGGQQGQDHARVPRADDRLSTSSLEWKSQSKNSFGKRCQTSRIRAGSRFLVEPRHFFLFAEEIYVLRLCCLHFVFLGPFLIKSLPCG